MISLEDFIFTKIPQSNLYIDRMQSQFENSIIPMNKHIHTFKEKNVKIYIKYRTRIEGEKQLRMHVKVPSEMQ